MRARLLEWARRHPPSYADGYIDMCVPQLLAPLVRLALLRWEPLTSGALSSLDWQRQVVQASSGAPGGDGGQPSESEQRLLASPELLTPSHAFSRLLSHLRTPSRKGCSPRSAACSRCRG